MRAEFSWRKRRTGDGGVGRTLAREGSWGRGLLGLLGGEGVRRGSRRGQCPGPVREMGFEGGSFGCILSGETKVQWLSTGSGGHVSHVELMS